MNVNITHTVVVAVVAAAAAVGWYFADQSHPHQIALQAMLTNDRAKVHIV
jgi:hypothetical protein